MIEVELLQPQSGPADGGAAPQAASVPRSFASVSQTCLVGQRGSQSSEDPGNEFLSRFLLENLLLLPDGLQTSPGLSVVQLQKQKR